MFNNKKKIKELTNEINRLEVKNANLQKFYEEKLNEKLSGEYISCTNCSKNFVSPKYKTEKLNQNKKTQLVAVCPFCGSKHLTITEEKQ